MINVKELWFLDTVMVLRKQSVVVYCPYPKPGSERERAVVVRHTDGLISFCGANSDHVDRFGEQSC